ncbi:MAG: methyltransferase [Candidatus Riflebacteria bacterium]|nr:methyltransferase [Candidatus Riflebacteria bacterium]
MNTVNDYYGKDLEAMAKAVNYHRWIIDGFSAYMGKTALEVGAGNGNFSASLLDCGIEHLVACEPSQNMFALLQSRFAGDARVTALNSCLESSMFEKYAPVDSVIYVNVLEHIEDDQAELKLVYECLRPGAHLLVMVPAFPGLMSGFDRRIGHFRRYLLRGLQKKTEKAGFTVINARYFDILGSFIWFFIAKLLDRDITPGNVHLYDSLVIPILKRFEKLLGCPFGKNLLLVARKDPPVFTGNGLA